MTDDVCGCSVSEKEEEESKVRWRRADSHKIMVLNRPEDKKQKENETPELLRRARIICFSPFDVDDQLMIVNVETLRQSCPQHYFFTEHLIILNISKLSECLQ